MRFLERFFSLAREMDKDTSADGCSMLGFVWSPQDVD